MSLRLARAVAETENLDDFHLARLLILLSSADRRRRTIATKARAVEGITKLAKLDFFLRYPTYLQRALRRLGARPERVHLEEREKTSIEAAMVRFRYGPWDARYRRWLGLLHSRGLVTLGLEGNTVMIGLTEAGRQIAANLREQKSLEMIVARSELIAADLGTMSATAIKDFVYQVVPEISSMKWGDEIVP